MKREDTQGMNQDSTQKGVSIVSPMVKTRGREPCIVRSPHLSPRQSYVPTSIRSQSAGKRTVPTATQGDGRRHFVSPARANPVLGGSKVEWPASRGMPYLQVQQEEEPKDDMLWKRIGIFKTSPKKASVKTPREAPHRSSSGFIAAQQMPSLVEQLRQSPRKQQSKDLEGLGAKAYFSNAPPEPPSTGVRRGYESHHTIETDLCIFQPRSIDQLRCAQVEEHLQKPLAVEGLDSEEEHLGRLTVQTARKNESSGRLEDGLICSSPSEGHAAALALPSRGRKNSQASLAAEYHTPCWATNPLPTKPVANQITDALPAYCSEDNVGRLMHNCEEAPAAQHQGLPDNSGMETMARLAPYAEVDTPTPHPKQNRSVSSPHLEIDGVCISSLMSSGHPAAIASKIDKRIDQTGLENASIKERVMRSQSMPALRPPISRSLSPQPRRMSLGSNNRDHLSSCVWSAGLRGQGQVRDKRGSGYKQMLDIVPENVEASALAVKNGQLKSPTLTSPDELKSQSQLEDVTDAMLKRSEARIQALLKRANSREQLEDVTSCMMKGCEARIQTLIHELDATKLKQMDSFRSDVSIGTTRSGSDFSYMSELSQSEVQRVQARVDEFRMRAGLDPLP